MLEISRKLSLVVPLWNEEKNVDALVEMLSGSQLFSNGLSEVILVNNGSSDSTGELVESAARRHSWIVGVHLKENLNYGGGIYEGCKVAKSDYLGYIPGDLQVSAEDVLAVWQEVLRREHSERIFFKGRRVQRFDGWNTRIVSVFYTILGNLILWVGAKDINGLPKIFHRGLLKNIIGKRAQNFVFDAQLIFSAKQIGWGLIEVPVTFYARRKGVSSWSGKRFKTYLETLKVLFYIRASGRRTFRLNDVDN